MNTNKLQGKIDALEKKLGAALPKNLSEPTTRQLRRELETLCHYYYLNQRFGANLVASERLEHTLPMASQLLWATVNRGGSLSERETAALQKEQVTIDLIDQYSRACIMAQYFYEKGSKILCQMVITIMDALLQQKADLSLLYGQACGEGLLNIRDELITLRGEYFVCWRHLYAFDFCVGKMSEFVGIEEYRYLVQEHERIIENGLPGKVESALRLLQKGEDAANFFRYPNYSAEIEAAYEAIVCEYGGEISAMADFAGLVIKMDHRCQNRQEV